MIGYIVRRILWLIPTLLVIYTMTFFVMHNTPGGPWDEGALPLEPSVIENIKIKFGLDKPIHVQYYEYLFRVVRYGDFGPSYGTGGRLVSEIIADFFPTSVQLGAMAMFLAATVGIGLGVTGAVYQETWRDHLATIVAVIGVSTPNFVVAILLVVVFGVQLKWVSLGVWTGVFSSRALLAIIALSLAPAAMLARYTRSSMIDVLKTDFIRTARSKGLPERVVLYKHALRNALIPVTTVLGISLAHLVIGSFFVESITMVPGIGRYFVRSVFGRDYPVIMGLTLLYATIVILMNLAVDIMYGIVDPRVRYG